jgi:hypothetical protein
VSVSFPRRAGASAKRVCGWLINASTIYAVEATGVLQSRNQVSTGPDWGIHVMDVHGRPAFPSHDATWREGGFRAPEAPFNLTSSVRPAKKIPALGPSDSVIFLSRRREILHVVHANLRALRAASLLL